MKRTAAFSAFLVVTMVTALPANAQLLEECGEPPIDRPTIPSGETLNAQGIRAARNAVVAYSETVDTYLQCMDRRNTILNRYMTETQRKQMNNDLAGLHDKRRELQLKMNDAIRAFRAANRGN